MSENISLLRNQSKFATRVENNIGAILVILANIGQDVLVYDIAPILVYNIGKQYRANIGEQYSRTILTFLHIYTHA